MSISDAAKLARYDDLAEAIEELHDENMVLLQAIRQTLDENGHLADGENCTLIVLKRALRKIGVPWKDDELPNVALNGVVKLATFLRPLQKRRQLYGVRLSAWLAV